MAIGPGTRLGAYEILSPLGAGAMGEVHRARDTKLGREIALKILPATFTSDPERVARFPPTHCSLICNSTVLEQATCCASRMPMGNVAM